MAQPTMSLFGPSVYDIQKEQALQDENAAIRQAALSPYQSIRADVAAMGSRFGRNIAGLFGVEDPRLKEASAMQELKNAINTQWDGTDPVEAYKIMAKEAARLGLTQQAIGAAAQVKQAEEAKAKTALGEAKTKADIAESTQRVAASKGVEQRETEREKRAADVYTNFTTKLNSLELAAKQNSVIAAGVDLQTKQKNLQLLELRIKEQQAELDALPQDLRKALAQAKLNKLIQDVASAKAQAGLAIAQTGNIGQTTQIIPPAYPGAPGTVVRVSPTGQVTPTQFGGTPQISLPTSPSGKRTDLSEEQQRQLVRQMLGAGLE